MMTNISELCFKYNIVESNYSQEQSKVCALENAILNSSYSNEIKRYDAAMLYKTNRANLIKQLNSLSVIQQRIKLISRNPNFTITDSYIFYNLFIPITTVIDENNCLVSLSTEIKQKLINQGFGITSFHIEKTHTIKDVWCQGKHPNMNPADSTFCIDSDLYDSSLDLSNMMFLIEMMSLVNIESFYRSKESEDFLSIIRS